MNAEIKEQSNATAVSPDRLQELAARVTELLRLRTLPIGMQLYKSEQEMLAVPGVRRPRQGRRFSSCQLVTQSRISGVTLGVTHENLLPDSNCGGVLGLNAPSELYLSGEKMNGVWFASKEVARDHQAQMPRVKSGIYEAVVISPLRMGRLDATNICLFYASPGQMILFVNGLQHRKYERYELSITGESACADSWGRALSTGKTSISIPCYAERRYGGVADDELLIAMPPSEFERGVLGLEALYKNGLRYPITPYSASIDPTEGLNASYPMAKN